MEKKNKRKKKINNLYLYRCTVISKGTYKTSSIPIVNTDGQSVVVLPWNGVFRSIFFHSNPIKKKKP